MKNIKLHYILSITAAFCILVSYCTFDNSQLSGGTTTETTNGCVIGLLKTTDDSPARQTIVKLIESNYDPVKDGPVPDSLVDTTGDSGEYIFHVAGGKTFNIEGRQNSSGEAVLISGVKVQNNDTVIVRSGAIRKTGAIKIMFPGVIDTADGYVYIRGTTIFAKANDTSGFVFLESVPPGVTPSVYYSVNSSSSIPKALADSVTIDPGATTVIGYQTGVHSAKLFLNTTASGAGIAGTVTNFPVLIRLREDNFDFTQAKADGGDIRFTKSNGAPFPYEIERWDPAARQAEVWVTVDTVFGNDSMQFFTMYWGEPVATIASDSAAVFDTATGFAGVWHLGETDSIALDATGNHYDGTGYSTTSVPGMIGNARHFNGNSSIIRMKGTASSRLDFPMNGRYTLSAWVYHDTLADSITYLVAGKGERQYFIKNFDLELSIGQQMRQWEFTEYHDNDWQSATIVPATAKSWIYLTGVRDGPNEYLYVNGILAMSKTFATNQSQLPRDTIDDFTIGGFLRPVTRYNQGYAYFSGVIDEVTVSSTPRSADWIKLNFMNQKEKDALVRWSSVTDK
jgi:hypothetical protein